MKRTYITKNNKTFLGWIGLSVIYFVGLKLFQILYDSGEGFPGFVTALLFFCSAPMFSVVSGNLAYKATARVIIPNIANVVIMVLVNARACIIEAKDTHRQYLRIGSNSSYGEVLLEMFGSLLLLALPIFIISVISSAITKAVTNRKNKKAINENEQKTI